MFEEHGLAPDVVAGTSIGAIIGAAYVFGVLDRFEEAARTVGWREIMRLADIKLGKSGFLSGEKIVNAVRDYIGEATFADAGRPFVCTVGSYRDDSG